MTNKLFGKEENKKELEELLNDEEFLNLINSRRIQVKKNEPLSNFYEPFVSVDKHEAIYNKKEMVNHPDHYNQGLLETMERFLLHYSDKPDYIKGALIFNIDKYLDRSPFKGKKEEDEKKAQFYLEVFELLFPDEFEMIQLYRNYKESK